MMETTMKHKISDLEGALLDAAVAKAEGFASFWIDPGDEDRGESCVLGPARAEDSRFDWCPSSAWEQGGPIIERELISVIRMGEPPAWHALIDVSFDAGNNIQGQVEMTGPTPLSAAMRAFVAAKFGPEVDLP